MFLNGILMSSRINPIVFISIFIILSFKKSTKQGYEDFSAISHECLIKAQQ